ncbi:hypothetical protein COU74_01015 [Candidatus Peregrinibacteria bacterium CG10_big_fil_rev_8_21_14_0_10_36_19]|nr:MAG: hypothetical protein COU74_01015 [Candidatus Peregrinibacteria bacterium CG10_big_fil_rev_8_21_14_0_10_36_19]
MTQEDLVIDAVKKNKDAVVSIIITKDVPVLEQYFDEQPLNDFFGFNFRVPKYRQNGTEEKQVGGGSGFIVTEDGYVVTNKHVVSDEEASYTVILNNGEKYEAKVLARDPLNDVAILKIEAKNLATLKFADSDSIVVGQTTIAIGNPLLEFSNSVSVGVVSGLSRSIVAGTGQGKSEQLDGVIQTDAAINPGNSGGPLLNLKGEVIGVNVAVASAENIGFSLPSNMVKKVFESVKEHGKIVRPFLGIRYAPITKELKEANKLSVDYGVIVSRGEKSTDLAVLPGSPADKAGLLENDIILEIDDKKVDDKTSLARIVAEKNVGDKIKLKVLSKGKEKTLEIKLEAIPE